MKSALLLYTILLSAASVIGQTKVAVINLLSFDEVTHHHIGNTVFNSHLRKYPVVDDLDTVISIAIDSLNIVSKGKYEYEIVNLDLANEIELSGVRKKKMMSLLDADVSEFDFVLFLIQGSHRAYLMREWYFPDLGFYTWTGVVAEVYAPINYYLASVKSSKGRQFRFPSKGVGSASCTVQIEKADRLQKGSIPEEAIASIKGQVLDLIVTQLVNLDSNASMTKAVEYLR